MSYHFCGIYLKRPFAADTLEFLTESGLSVPESDTGEAFTGVMLSDASDSHDWEDLLEDASRRTEEAILLAVQANVGFFHYQHWLAGLCVRHLECNSDTGWYLVEGQADPWERDLFFSDHKILDDYLFGLRIGMEADSDYMQRVYAPQAALCQEIWDQAVLREGSFFPTCNEELAAGKIAVSFGFKLFPLN